MTGYLLDTNVVSTFEPGRPESVRPTDVTRAWFVRHSRVLFISAVTVMEIESGIQRLVKGGSARRRAELSAWLFSVVESYGERVLGFDREVALAAGGIEARAILNGRHPGLADVVIAATAATHRLTILTRNIRHFLPLGVSAENPFDA